MPVFQENRGELGRRVGLLGGTFDPVHNGHLAVASYVREKLFLDSVVFVPAAAPPHKREGGLTPFQHRRKMLDLALAEFPGFFVSTIESTRKGPSYTVDTLKELNKIIGSEQRLFFIIGMDAFSEFTTWKEYKSIPALTDIVVIDRPEHPLGLTEKVVARLGGYSFDPERLCWSASGRKGKIHALVMPAVNISSTRVRQVAAAGNDLYGLVPVPVAEYIREHCLYRQVVL